MDNNIVLTIHVNKEQEKQYLKVYFDVPPDVESMTVAYSYEGDNSNSNPVGEKNVIDFALIDNEGNEVGASGSSLREIKISECCSSPGYKKTAVNEGRWCIVCGAYLVKKKRN